MKNENKAPNADMLIAMNEAVDILISHSEETLYGVMGRGLWPVADAAAVDRIAIYKVAAQDLSLEQIYRWDRWEGGSLPIDEAMRVVPKIAAIADWMAVLTKDDCVCGRASGFNDEQGLMLNPYHVKTYLLAPVFTRGRIWGIVAYYDCTDEREFSEDAVAFLRSAARLCTSSFIRDEQAQSANDAEERIQLMLDATPLCCELWDRNIKLLDCNAETVKFFGASKQEILDGIFDFSPEFQPCGMRSTEKAAMCVEKTLESGAMTTEWTHLLPDGTIIPTEITVVPVKYKNDRIVAVYTRDLREYNKMISERERREELMDSLNKAAMTFLSQSSKSFEDMMSDGVGLIADSIRLDRLSVWRNVQKPDGLYASQSYRWDRGSGGTTTPTPGLESLSYPGLLPRWEALLKNNEVINGPVRLLPEREAGFLQAFGVVSAFIAPVFSENHFWGLVLFEDRRDERVFDRDCAQFLRSAAYLCTNTVIKADIEHQLAARLKQQEVMADISAGLVASDDATELVSEALGKLGRYCDVSVVLVFSVDHEKQDAGLAYQWVNENVTLKLADFDLFAVIGSTFPLTMPDSGDAPKVVCHNTAEGPLPAYKVLHETGIQSIICVPIYTEGRLWGIMSIEQYQKQRDWKTAEVDFILMAVSTISGAIVRDIYDARLKAAYEQATLASQAKSDFLTGMSHEMRTPMNAVVGMTAIGKNTGDVERKNYAFTKIEDAATHLLGVINDVLDMSKIEANRLELSPIAFDLERVLRKVLSVIQFRVDEKHQMLTFTVDQAVPRFLIGDDQRITQVLANLLANAVKFTREHGEIGLAIALLSESGGVCELRFEVSDTGIGIAPENRERIFQPFTQAESGTSREYGGTGLGLGISRRIVELMDGNIWVESELDKGSRFIFTIKARRDLAAQSASGQSASDPPFSSAIDCPGELADAASPLHEKNRDCFRGKTVLIAEDIEINREILTLLLENTGVAIDCAENGLEAFRMVEKYPARYSLILMDVQMPQMDGLEATRRIRALTEAKAAEIPIIAMTAHVFKDDIDLCLAAGMNAHLGKPIETEALMAALNAYLADAAQ